MSKIIMVPVYAIDWVQVEVPNDFDINNPDADQFDEVMSVVDEKCYRLRPDWLVSDGDETIPLDGKWEIVE